MGFFRVTDDQVAQFERDGYLFVENFLLPDEVEGVKRVARGDDDLTSHSMDVTDASGRKSRLALWNHPSDDVFGTIARSERVVNTMERMLGGEVYHYHSKVMMKEPKVGGAWEWHQDYGYWYQNGCLFPYMASCMIALDRATKENGCLQVLKGSHHLGRIEHGFSGEQTGADRERVEAAMKRLELVHCLMEPGTALFFHGNLLHASAANESEHPRWVLICCYNAARNDPYKESHHPRYTPLSKLPDTAVREALARPADHQRTYLKAAEDKTIATAKK